jgi:transposase-like protein
MLGSQDRATVWGERLRRYERSGLTVAEFCQREGVSAPSFYQWRRRLFETSDGPRAKRVARMQRCETAAAFQQVMLTGGGVVAIELPNGVRMELPAHQASLVRAVVAELLRSESGGAAGDA